MGRLVPTLNKGELDLGAVRLLALCGGARET